ncbi:hypothetical protein HQQ81_17630 [Microbacteriaceae bacterium VKM Ac-2854]|jgi:hypothetical protein|nr:hypothetical protein [Microbacteriaceae bacterium VKM Ac-2854]
MTGFGVIASFVLFLGGILLMGNAFLVPEWGGVIFFGGILAISASLAVGFHLLPKSE